MTKWYFVRDGRREGPVSAEFIADELRRGRLTEDDRVWMEDFEAWRPISELPELHELAAQTPPPLPSEMAEAAAAALAERLAPPPVQYASFPARVFALLIDSAILMVPGLITLFIVAAVVYATNEKFDIQNKDDAEYLQAIFNLCAIPVLWLYYAGFESSRLQGTPGKILMGIRVTDIDGQRLSFPRASLRFFWKQLTLPIGFVLAISTGRRQALHDLLAGSLVLFGR